MASYLIFGITYAFAAAAQPGPFQAYIISQAVNLGWKRTLPAAFSPILSDVPIVIFALLLLSRVDDGFFRFLHLGGGLFLFFLSSRSFKAWWNFSAKDTFDAQSGPRTLFHAAIVNILNPNPYMSWSLILGPLFLKGWRETPIHGISLLLAFYCTMIICLIGVIILFAFARNLGSRVNRISLGLSALALAGFGIYQIGLGLHLV